MKRYIDKPVAEKFDLVIIGGGITGATLAYEASTQGLKVALFEKGDFGGATSAATSKLIHGGLRYLKNFEFGLVRESLKERRILENIAPNFVYPLPFMIPTYKSLKSNKWILLIGMILYDILSFDRKFTWDKTKKLPGFKLLSVKKSLKKETCLKKKDLTGTTVYYDCQNIFPERLTLAFLKSAEKYGAKISNYAQVTSFITKDQCVKGVIVKDLLNHKSFEIPATVVINCSGPWADILLNTVTQNKTIHSIRRSEGIHIITRKICQNHSVTMMTKDDKHIMLMPWRNHTLIGTTDKEYIGNPDDYAIKKDTIQELVDMVNENYADTNLKYEDVLFAYGGLRPITEGQSTEIYQSSRKYEIFDNADEGLNGLITVEGGKYTTSRKLAVNVMKIVGKKLKKQKKKSISDQAYLMGCEIKDIEEFLKTLKHTYSDFGINTIDYLGRNYGTECHQIFEIAREKEEYKAQLNADGEILAQVVYAIKNEMALSLSDILFRRTGVGLLGHPGNLIIKQIAALAKTLLAWDDKRLNFELKQVANKFKIPE